MLSNRLKLKSLCVALALMVGAPLAAQAGTTSSSFAVTATVTASCQINSASAIAFGNYDPVSANKTTPATATGTVAVTCTKTTAATVTMDQGLDAASGSSCTTPLRQMKGGTSNLAYSIYQDAAHSLPWGCTAGTNSQAFTSTSGINPFSLTTYGSIPQAQDVPSGSYADTVTVTVSF